MTTQNPPALPNPQAPVDLLTATPLVEGVPTANLPDTWQQGRGLFGGIVTAALVRAMETRADGRRLRSLTAEICGPAQPGLARLPVEPLRVGNAVSTLATRLIQRDADADAVDVVQAHAVGVFGADRVRDHDRRDIEPPARLQGDWRDVDVAAVAPPLGPTFAQHIAFRPLTGFPFTGGEPLIEGWVAPQSPRRLDVASPMSDAAYLALCIDTYWPSLYVVETRPRPMATIAFTMQVLGTITDHEAPLYYRGRCLVADAGYCVEQRELWSVDGRLLAMNQQTIAVIK